MGVATMRAPAPLWFGASKPDQKVGPIGGTFKSTDISESCFRNFPIYGIITGSFSTHYLRAGLSVIT